MIREQDAFVFPHGHDSHRCERPTIFLLVLSWLDVQLALLIAGVKKLIEIFFHWRNRSAPCGMWCSRMNNFGLPAATQAYSYTSGSAIGEFITLKLFTKSLWCKIVPRPNPVRSSGKNVRLPWNAPDLGISLPKRFSVVHSAWNDGRQPWPRHGFSGISRM